MMDPLTTSSIKQRARELRFDLCGVAPAADHPELKFFREWLDRGYGGTMTYLHRSAAPGEEPELLAAAVAALDLPAGRGHVFVHGEASSVRNLRRHLIADRGLDPATMSISGYWKLKRTEEGWREDKAEWNRLVAADVS